MATFAFAWNGTEDEKEAAKKSWRDLAAEFWKRASMSGAANKAKKLYRAKVFQWLCATEHMLKIATGRGWLAFAQPLENRGPPETWPSVTLCVDQGGDGCIFHFCFLRFYGLGFGAWDLGLGFKDLRLACLHG